MKNFLQKIKLIDHLTLKLFISKSEFVRRLSAITDKEKIGRFF